MDVSATEVLSSTPLDQPDSEPSLSLLEEPQLISSSSQSSQQRQQGHKQNVY